MRRIAVMNQKGGVGKTTTAVNLGAALARSGRRVLLVDLDPQAHLTLHFGVELSDDQPSVYDVLVESMPLDRVARTIADNLTLVPSDIDLAAAESELVSVMGREVILREALEPVKDQHDVLLIDCPPSLGVLTINALSAAHEVLIPLQAQFFALQGLSKLLDTVTLVRQRINPQLTVSGVVLALHEAATRLAGEVVHDLCCFLEAARGTTVPWSNATIYESRIRRNIKLAEASSFGQSIFDYEPRSNGAADYAALAVEIFPEIRAAAAEWSQVVGLPLTERGDVAPIDAETESPAVDASSSGPIGRLDGVCPSVLPLPVIDTGDAPCSAVYGPPYDVNPVEHADEHAPAPPETPASDSLTPSRP